MRSRRASGPAERACMHESCDMTERPGPMPPACASSCALRSFALQAWCNTSIQERLVPQGTRPNNRPSKPPSNIPPQHTHTHTHARTHLQYFFQAQLPAATTAALLSVHDIRHTAAQQLLRRRSTQDLRCFPACTKRHSGLTRNCPALPNTLRILHCMTYQLQQQSLAMRLTWRR